MARQRRGVTDQAASLVERSAETAGAMLGKATRALADAGTGAVETVQSMARSSAKAAAGTAENARSMARRGGARKSKNVKVGRKKGRQGKKRK